MAIGFYNNTFDKNSSVVAANEVCAWIANGKWKDTVEYLRKLNKAEYDAEKKKLPAVTWSGVFEDGTRSIETLKKYSNFLCLDVDNLDVATINTIKGQMKTDPYVIFCFTSPSGKGIKIIVCVDSKPENHRAAFLHLQHYFETTYFIKIDKSGKDVSRLCYMSYDPEAVWGDAGKIQVFHVELKYGEIVTANAQSAEEYKASKDNQHIFKVCVGWVEKKFQFVSGDRNNYVHALACALNRCGVPMDVAESMIITNFQGLEAGEFNATMRSAYFHNMGEHGSVQVRDMGAHEFVAPPYIANYNQDVVLNDLMTITATLWHKGVDKAILSGIVVKVAKYYQSQGYIDINRDDLKGLMNKAVEALNQNIAANASQNSLSYESSEGIAEELLNQDTVSGVVPTGIPEFDAGMRGGLQPGNFYGIVGVGGTWKSVIAQSWSYNAAKKDYAVLYLNGEMSRQQYYERLVLMTLGVSFFKKSATGELTKENVAEFIKSMQLITKNNIFVVNGNGFDQKNVNATIDHIFATTGKKVKMVVIDGVTQMNDAGKEEIPAAIMNTGVCKELAKTGNNGEGVVVVGLMHVSGDQDGAKLRRDSGPKCRGGGKTIAQMDGYFSTSLLIDPNQSSIDDVQYMQQKVYVRLVDKRSPAGVISAIINITDQLHLEHEICDPRQYELKIN